MTDHSVKIATNGTETVHEYKYDDGFWKKITYDEFGREILFMNSNNFWYKRTYNESGEDVAYQSPNLISETFRDLKLAVEYSLYDYRLIVYGI